MGNCLTEFNEEAYRKGLWEEGRELGLEQACIENAKNFFQNGVSYDIVRASITQLSDAEITDCELSAGTYLSFGVLVLFTTVTIDSTITPKNNITIKLINSF